MFTKPENSFLTTGHGHGTSMCASAYLSSESLENPFQVADSEFRPLDGFFRGPFQSSSPGPEPDSEGLTASLPSEPDSEWSG